MPWFILAGSSIAALAALFGWTQPIGKTIASTSAPAAASLPAAPSEVRVVTPDERRAFYRGGGKEQLGRTVHLHVESEVLRKEPYAFTDRAGAEWVRFENRDVPLLIPAKSPYWLQVRRHRAGAKEFCLRGVVRLLPGDERQRASVQVTKIVRAPGGWR
ncbi:MAG: hypothetical protein FJ293_15515 [Planctomycetes bacterium]|nr:hypothetical protein [Planctomycetota bacterium]